MVMVIAATAIFEIFSYLLSYILTSINIEIINFIKILSIIVYPLIQKAGYYIENEYKGNKILTKYF